MEENLLEEKIARMTQDYLEKTARRKIPGKAERRKRLYNKRIKG